MPDIVDACSSEEIKAAIKIVNRTLGLRSKVGLEALWLLFKAPKHTLSHQELADRFKAPGWHFGWFCRRIAEELGDENPSEYALTDRWTAEDGTLMLTLKPSVVAAMSR
ncbi:MAG TPA: hypothetical protein VJ770_18725 [Stellaceae bacterium]|nr:hypothetical protein [Stellaceae bacterium]